MADRNIPSLDESAVLVLRVFGEGQIGIEFRRDLKYPQDFPTFVGFCLSELVDRVAVVFATVHRRDVPEVRDEVVIAFKRAEAEKQAGILSYNFEAAAHDSKPNN